MTGTEQINFIVEPLSSHHNRRVFSCGDDVLDRYIHQQAGQDQRNNVAAVYVLTEPPATIIGFYTLSMNSILLEDIPQDIRRQLPRYPNIPAALLGRLAVDQRYRGRNLGEHLLMDAMQRCLNSEIATFCLIVDAYDNTVDFYRKFGFMNLPNRANRLFIPLSTIEEFF